MRVDVGRLKTLLEIGDWPTGLRKIWSDRELQILNKVSPHDNCISTTAILCYCTYQLVYNSVAKGASNPVGISPFLLSLSMARPRCISSSMVYKKLRTILSKRQEHSTTKVEAIFSKVFFFFILDPSGLKLLAVY